MKVHILLISMGLIYSCGQFSDQIDNAGPRLEHTYLTEENQTNPQIRGFWKSVGNGYLLEVNEDSIGLYSYTSTYCYKEKNDYLEELLNSQSRYILLGDTLSIYLTDYGEETKSLQVKKDFIKINNLPDGCMTFDQMLALNKDLKLNLYHESMQENYAFADVRQLEWTQIFEPLHKELHLDEGSLFEVMGKVAITTKDQHTKVISAEGTSRQYRITPSAQVVQKSFENQTDVKELNSYFNYFFEKSRLNISDSLLWGKGRKVLNGNIEWGRIDAKTGYIHIASFAGFLSKDFTRRQQIDSIKASMNVIIDSLQTAQAIIVDISFNFGGFDASALTLAGYFTEKPVFAYTSQVFNENRFYIEDSVFVIPAEKTFTKPVYLVMTDISRSAAESYAMMMDVLPHVTLVGTNTLGTLSGMLGKSIGDFYITISNQKLVNSEGEFFEKIGVQPDISMEVFTEMDVMNDHHNMIRRVVDLIEEKENF